MKKKKMMIKQRANSEEDENAEDSITIDDSIYHIRYAEHTLQLGIEKHLLEINRSQGHFLPKPTIFQLL